MSTNSGKEIANLHFYNVIVNSKEIETDIYSICEILRDLEESLAISIEINQDSEIKDKAQTKIRDKGKQLYNLGGDKLMTEVAKLLGIQEYQYNGYLNSLWDGIGNWWA